MSDEISPELKAEFERFLSLRKSGENWHAKLAHYASTLQAHELDYLVALCDDNDSPIQTVPNTLA